MGRHEVDAFLIGARDGGDLSRSLYLQDWFPYPRATNTHNSANERSSSNRFRNAKIFVAAVLWTERAAQVKNFSSICSLVSGACGVPLA